MTKLKIGGLYKIIHNPNRYWYYSKEDARMFFSSDRHHNSVTNCIKNEEILMLLSINAKYSFVGVINTTTFLSKFTAGPITCNYECISYDLSEVT